MLKKMAAKRDSITWFLLLSFVPLEMFPFFCESDSIYGKILLVLKFSIILAIYGLHARVIDLKYHIMLILTAVSLSVSSIINGGLGVSLLILTMLMAMVAFPVVNLPISREKQFWGLMSAGLLCVFLYASFRDIQNGLPLFGKGQGTFNGNTYGLILIGMLFYFVSFLGAISLPEKKRHLLVAICTVVALGMLLWDKCRTSLLSICVFLVCYLIYAVGKQKTRLWFYIVVVGSSILCFVVLLCLDILPGKTGFIDDVISGRVLGKKILSGRERLWKVALYGFADKPLWGNGSTYLLKIGHLTSAHNVLLGIMICSGIIPTLTYLWLLLHRNMMFEANQTGGSRQCIRNNSICFIACVAVTAFECAFTDNQLNLLFLPLLLNPQNISGFNENNVNIYTEQLLVQDRGSKETVSKEKKMDIPGYIWLALVVAALLVFSVEPHILMKEARREFSVQDVEIPKDNIENGHYLLNGAQDYFVQNNVIWEHRGNSIYVEGSPTKATQYYCYLDKKNLPRWIEKGKCYQVTYSAQNVRLQIICYPEEGKNKMILNTTQNAEFIVPENAIGLNIRLYISPGIQTSETISPLIQLANSQ